MTCEAPEKRCTTADPEVMTSTHPADHERAKKFCANCPAFDWCQRNTKDALAHPSWGLGVEGTWAGVLYKEGRVMTVVKTPGRRRRVVGA